MTTEEFLAPFADALSEAHKHARAVYPAESCGMVVSGRYIACENVASDEHTDEPGCRCKLCSFEIKAEDYAKHAGRVQILVHSHPNGPAHPSKADMQMQEAMDVAWVILTLDDTRDGPTVAWGGDIPMEPIVGREFVHGVTDCYSLIRDVFSLGRDELLKQDIDWPYDPITLPVYPRNDEWWVEGEDNFYEEKPALIGFREIASHEARPGDVFLASIRSDKLNHGGVMLGNNLILHHLPGRLSRREPAGIWAYSAEKWLRYEGATE